MRRNWFRVTQAGSGERVPRAAGHCAFHGRGAFCSQYGEGANHCLFCDRPLGNERRRVIMKPSPLPDAPPGWRLAHEQAYVAGYECEACRCAG